MLETRPGHGGRSGGCSRKSWGWFAANEVMGQVNKGEVSGAQRLTDVLWNVQFLRSNVTSAKEALSLILAQEQEEGHHLTCPSEALCQFLGGQWVGRLKPGG